MHIPADVLNDSCGCSTVPLKLNDLTSAPSHHYYCMALWPFLLIRTAVHYSQTGKNWRDAVLQGKGVPPIKNHPLNYEWTFDLISCDALTDDCGGVFSGNLLDQSKRRGFWDRNSKLFILSRQEKKITIFHEVSMALCKFMYIYFEAESLLLLSSEHCHHTFIQWWINNAN